MTDQRERERLRWRCRRGLLELDLLLQRFMARELDRLTDGEHAALCRLLELPDNELLDYCYDRARLDDPALHALVRRIAG